MLDINDILKPAPSGAHPLADNDQSDLERIVAVVMQQQEGINLLTSLLAEHKHEIEALKGQVRLLRARTDPPKQRPTIIRVQ